MTTNVKVFKSTDTGAPSLSGTAATLIALLDACLVNGYNSKSATITRSGSVATATITGHGFLADQCILVSGANEAEYNGEQYVATVVDANTITFAVTGSPATPATGTITIKQAPAGWTKPYTGTNKAAFRCGGGNQMYLRLDDSQSQHTRAVGYQAMTDVDTGTDQFPTSLQQSGGLYWWKSQSADSTARPWILVANDRTLYLWVNGNSNTTGTYADIYHFGDCKAYMAGDQFATHIWGDLNTTPFGYGVAARHADPSSSCSGHYVCRNYTYAGGSQTAAKFFDAQKGCLPSYIGYSGLAYPNPTDGGLYLSRVWAGRASHVRGELPGFWAPLHGFPLTQLDTFTGSGDLAGRKFIALRVATQSTVIGEIFLETSNTWDV